MRDHDKYPLNDYVECTPSDVLEAAYDLKTTKGKTDPIQWPVREQGEEDGAPPLLPPEKGTELWTLVQFQDLLYSRRVCVWDECNRRKKLSK